MPLALSMIDRIKRPVVFADIVKKVRAAPLVRSCLSLYSLWKLKFIFNLSEKKYSKDGPRYLTRDF
jgi:hypothetical protein